MNADPHKPLRDDVRLLGDLLGACLRQQEGPELFERVELVRDLSKRARRGDASARDALSAAIAELSPSLEGTVARAFAQFLNLANIAEQVHRIRRRRQYAAAQDAPPQRGSIEELFDRLERDGLSCTAIADCLEGLQIDLVFTAHPTEIRRRTIRHKHARIAGLLLDTPRDDGVPAKQAHVRGRGQGAAW